MAASPHMSFADKKKHRIWRRSSSPFSSLMIQQCAVWMIALLLVAPTIGADVDAQASQVSNSSALQATLSPAGKLMSAFDRVCNDDTARRVPSVQNACRQWETSNKFNADSEEGYGPAAEDIRTLERPLFSASGINAEDTQARERRDINWLDECAGRVPQCVIDANIVCPTTVLCTISSQHPYINTTGLSSGCKSQLLQCQHTRVVLTFENSFFQPDIEDFLAIFSPATGDLILKDVSAPAMRQIFVPLLGSYVNWSNLVNLNVTQSPFHTLFLQKDMFKRMANLTLLDLSDCDINDVPPNTFSALSKLKTLNLAHNNIEKFDPDAFDALTQLNALSLTDNQLRDLPVGLFDKLSNVYSLDLSENYLRELNPALFEPLLSLNEIDVHSNSITSVPANVFQRQTLLAVVQMWANEITSLSGTAFQDLRQLTFLDMSDNLLSSLHPTTFATASSMSLLRFDYNSLTTLPDQIFDNMPLLLSVTMINNNITHLPEDIFVKNTMLTQIDLSENPLNVVSPKWFSNKYLKTIELSHTQVNAWPPGLLDNVPSLATFEFSHSSLTSVPGDAFFNCKQLTSLDLSHNQLQALPKDLLKECRQLKYLSLQANQLNVLPDFAAFATSLQYIDVHDNSLETLPITELVVANDLNYVDVSSNPLILDFDAVDALRVAQSLYLEGVVLQLYVKRGYFMRSRIQSVSLGWPGMNENSVPPEVLCWLMNPQMTYFSLRKTSYTSFNISCLAAFSANTVIITDNPALEHIDLPFTMSFLNVSNNPELTHLEAGAVEILDASKSGLPFSPLFCSQLGTRVLIARAVAEEESFRSQVAKLLSQCSGHIEYLDLSENAWMNNLPAIQKSFGGTGIITASSSGVVDYTRRQVVFDAQRVTSLVLVGVPIRCNVDVKTELVDEFDANPSGVMHRSRAVFERTCDCADGFHLDDQQCVRDSTSLVAPVLLSIVGGVLLTLIVLLVARFARRFRSVKTELYLRERLLADVEEEVSALKAAWQIDETEIDLIQRIDGSTTGAFGEVWQARWESMVVAVKVLKAKLAKLDASIEEFSREAEFLQKARHPNLVRFFGAGTFKSGSPFLVLELVARGSLKDFLTQDLDQFLLSYLDDPALVRPGRGTMSLAPTRHRSSAALPSQGSRGSRESRGSRGSRSSVASTGGTAVILEGTELTQPGEAGFEVIASPSDITQQLKKTSGDKRVGHLKLAIARDIANGMHFIHSRRSMHRDLKSANVLVSENLRAKISDFGSMRLTLERRASSNNRPSGLAFDGNDSLDATSCIGTPLYMAPEVMAGEPYGFAADVFSYGVVLWEIAYQRTPDLVEQESVDSTSSRGPILGRLKQLLTMGKRLKFDEDCPMPEWFQTLAVNCMNGDPRARPTFEHIMSAFSFL